MNYLLINKFLHPNGGSETYIFELGKYLKAQGHNVQYFGMEHEGRIVGNNVDAYTSDMDFHGGSIFSKLTYPVKTIYSSEARKQLRKVLEDMKPDVCHINNFNYQLTPSIILEIVKWRKQTGRECKIIHTAHDYQLVCPNHMMYVNDHVCQQCLGGKFGNCSKNKCIHGSGAKSLIGQIEAIYWNRRKVYEYFDKIICPSEFLKNKLDSNPVLAGKTVAVHNFVNMALKNGADAKDEVKIFDVDKTSNDKVLGGRISDDEASGNSIFSKDNNEKYVLYFGRFSEEKGFRTLVKVMENLKYIKFVVAGTGPLEDMIPNSSNVQKAGFVRGKALQELIAGAVCSVYPSEWYENCPLSVLESIQAGTPVIGADIGGIPELIKNNETGLLFQSGNSDELSACIRKIYDDSELIGKMKARCLKEKMMGVAEYVEKIGL